MKPSLRALVMTALLAAATPVRAAEPTADEIAAARTLFDAGAQAYAAERYVDAVKSFEAAKRLAPKPQIVFSLAQAERKLGARTSDVRTLSSALEHFKEYLERVPKGGRRADAEEAKNELEARLKALGPTAPPVSPREEKKKPRVTVISATPGARVSFDGGEPQELPLFVDLEPGAHQVRVFAEGFFDEVVPVSGDKLVDVPLNLPLREKPARLDVRVSVPGDLYVDGRLVATTPAAPVEVAPGVHVVSVSVNGKRAWSQEITFVRDRPVRVEPRLERSDQRLASYVVLGGGGLVTLVGLVSGVGALSEEGRAKDILEKQSRENISEDERDRYNKSIDRRDAARITSIVTLSAGGALLVSGALLWLLDKPSVAVVPPRTPDQRPPAKPASLELTASPIVAPGTWGGALVGRF